MKIAARIFLGFSIVIALSMVDSYVNYTLSRQVDKNMAFLASSEAVIRNSSKIYTRMVNMQSAFRGYLLTADKNFLDPYYEGIHDIPLLLKEEYALIGKSRSQVAKLDSAYQLHKEWVSYATELIAARQGTGSGPGQAYRDLFEGRFRTQVGKKLNDSIGMKFRDFNRYEYQVRESRRALLAASIARTHTYSLVFVILTLVIGLTSAFFIIRLITKRIDSMVKLAEHISRGQFVAVTDTANDELSGLSRSLNTMSQTLNRNISELEKRNRELNQFAYVVSHDLKAPVRGINNVVQWIEEDLGHELSAEMKKYLGIIPERIRRMEGLIDGLLDYARISREKAPEKRAGRYACAGN